MRKDFDPTTIASDERKAAMARLFNPGADGSWCGNVEGAMLSTRCTLPAYGNDTFGTGPELHVHPYDEIFIIVAGDACFFVGDAIFDATAGEVVFGPAGVPHRFENLGSGRLQTIDVLQGSLWLQADIADG